MTQDAAEKPPPHPGPYRPQFSQLVSELFFLARRVLPMGPADLSGPGPRAGAIIKVLTHRAPLFLGAAFLLGVAGWFAFELWDYEPVRSDDNGTRNYIHHVLSEPGVLSQGSVVVQRQLPLLQYVVYPLLVAIFGWGFPLVAVPFLFSVALSLAVGYSAYVVTGRTWAFLVAAAAVASLPVFLLQARSLPLYPAVLFCGYGGLAAALIYLRGGGKWTLGLAVAGLVGTLYSYNVGILFLPVPVLYVLVDRKRTVILRLARLYGPLAVLAIPFIVWHLAVGGVDGFFRQDIMWMVDKGYLLIRNVEFYGYGSTSLGEFLGKIPRIFQNAAHPLTIPFVGLAFLGFLRLPNWSWRAAVLLALAIPMAALVYKSPSAHSRYVYIFLPALVLLSTYGLAGLLDTFRAQKRTLYILPVAGLAVMVLLSVTLVRNVDAQVQATREIASSKTQQELGEIASLIDDEKAVLGSRAGALIAHRRSNRLLSTRWVSEDDFVTYLSWPSEGAVAKLFHRNDVGWVLIRKSARRWERNYNVWLGAVTGQLPQHHLKLETSGLVRRVYNGNAFILYKVVERGA